MSTYPWIKDSVDIIGGPVGYLAITSTNGIYLAAGANSIVSTNNQDINIIANGPTDNINLITNGGSLTINNNGAIGIGDSSDFGTDGQVLTSQGSGALPTWSPISPPSGFTYKEVLKYSSAGTFSIDLLTSYPNARMFVFTAVGGGGGGGSATTAASQISFGMGGGGGGAYVVKMSAADVFAGGGIITIIVGAGGSAGAIGGSGGAGGLSRMEWSTSGGGTAQITGYGGTNGTSLAPGAVPYGRQGASGGNGGFVNAGTSSLYEEKYYGSGSESVQHGTVTMGILSDGGYSGLYPYRATQWTNSFASGAGGVNWGSGGGGALTTAPTAPATSRAGTTGGAGKNGICLIEIWE